MHKNLFLHINLQNFPEGGPQETLLSPGEKTL